MNSDPIPGRVRLKFEGFDTYSVSVPMLFHVNIDTPTEWNPCITKRKYKSPIYKHDDVTSQRNLVYKMHYSDTHGRCT